MSDSTVEARVKGKEYAFAAGTGANLLGAALAAKVPLDHICRVGLCGACQVRVVEGGESLSSPTDQERLFLDERPLAEGVRLACQARVLGDVRVVQ